MKTDGTGISSISVSQLHTPLKELQLAVSGGWLEKLKDGHLRLHEWIRTTAPQLPCDVLPAPKTASAAT